MDFDIYEFTLLTREQVIGDKKILPIEKYGAKCPLTDFAKALGAYVSTIDVDYDYIDKDYDNCTEGRTGRYYLSSSDLSPDDLSADCVDERGYDIYESSDERYCAREVVIYNFLLIFKYLYNIPLLLII